MAPQTARYWWYSHGEIARLLSWLDERGELLDVGAAIDVVEKPWHWDSEYEEMCREQSRVAQLDAAADRYDMLAEIADEVDEP